MEETDSPRGEVLIDAPPAVPRATPVPVVARVLPVVLAVAMVGMMVVYFRSGAAATRGPAVMFFPAMMAMSVLASLVYSLRSNGQNAELERDRREYLRYLDGLDALTAETARAQWDALHGDFPDPATLWTLVDGARRWERDPRHRQFCEVRIGLGRRPLQTRLVPPESGDRAEEDPVSAAALSRLLRARATVDDVPVTVRLRDHYELTGPAEQVHGLLRAVLCQLAVWHSPHHLRIATALEPGEIRHWDWLKWLPHHWADAHTPLRYPNVAQAFAHKNAVPLIIVAGDCGPVPPTDGVTVLSLGSDAADARIDVGPDRVRIGELDARPDTMTVEQALACARRLARHRPTAAVSTSRSDWAHLIGLEDLDQIDTDRLWGGADPRRHLRVPIGVSEKGARVDLDLKEAAQNGAGPHGLCIGATGSGKSEFLRTLVLGLVTTHSPDALNLVLVDFKGGATFLGLERAPHVSALITNLADEATMVDRMADALAGEMTRRQELLRAAGNVGSVTEYQRTCRDLPPLPTLVIVVDEFSELLHQHPDFADLFVAIGRLGRSLGMHLLLASQRLDEGRLRGLESHLSYRVCLKTFSPSESRAVLGVTDAYDLPNTPGAAYLKTPSGEITRFHTAFVSGPHTVAALPAPAPDPGVRVFTARRTVFDRPRRTHAGTVLDVTLARLVGRGNPAHRVWLPPLPLAIPLSDVLMTAAEPLTVAVGLVDRPFEQRRDRLLVDLAGAAGNVAIVGGPQSGKSTTARTLMVALAATHHPSDVQMYGLDLGGGALSALTVLPHVGAVAGRRDTDLVRRIIAQLHDVVRSRERRFDAMGVDSMAEYRARRARRGDDPYGDVFLVVDGWSTLRTEFDDLDGAITALAGQGLSYGVHVVVTAARWAELRPALKDQLGTRIELRLGDPAESEMDRRRARQVAQSSPGRGLTRDGHELLIALPRLDGTAEERELGAALARVGGTLRAQYPGVQAPAVRLLPGHVRCSDVAGIHCARPATQVVLGVGERELAPVTVDFAEQPDLIVLGDGGCGKTTALRTLCEQLVRTNAPTAVELLVVDYRRGLLGAVESAHLRGYAVSAGALETAVAALLETLRERMPGPDVTPRQLRDRTWWAGPELYVVVDDYDLVAGGALNPLAPLLDFLPHARDFGLHLVIARRSGGAARAMFDPVLSRVKELGCLGLMMSASPDDGVLLGSVRPGPLPPGRGTLITHAGPEQLIQVALPCDAL